MVDDDDLAGSTPILQGPFRALTHIQFPATHHSLEDGRAVHGLAEQFQLRIGGCRHRVSPGLAGTASGAPCPALSISGISPSGDREAGGVQGRRLVRRLRSGFPCGPTGASGSALLLCGFRHAPGCAARTCERRVFPRRGFESSDPESALPEMLGVAVVEDPLALPSASWARLRSARKFTSRNPGPWSLRATSQDWVRMPAPHLWPSRPNRLPARWGTLSAAVLLRVGLADTRKWLRTTFARAPVLRA